MSIHESVPAECVVWRERFRNYESVVNNGGTIVGAPGVDKGITLNGSSQYVSYVITNTLLSSAKISIVIEFTPNFDVNTTVYRVFMDTTTNNHRIALIDEGQTLDIRLGGTTIVSIPYATYSAPWKAAERNVLVISGTTGVTNAWLNGTQILTNDNTAWTPSAPITLTVGSDVGALGHFTGEIHSVSIHDIILTADEALAYYKNDSFTYIDRADVWLGMATQSSDGTNQITKDKSGNSHDFKLGDGTTASTQPAFSNPYFDLDGSTDYLLNSSAAGIYNNLNQSIVIKFIPDFNWDGNADYYLFDSTSAAEYSVVKEDNAAGNVLTLTLGNTTIASVASSVYSSYWNAHGLNVLVVAGTTGNTDMWLNNFKILSADSTAWSAANPADIVLGAEQGLSGGWYDGELGHFSTYSTILSPIQARDIANRLLSEFK